MHFALPPKKSAPPIPHSRGPMKRDSNQRRKNLQLLFVGISTVLTFFLLIRWIRATRSADNGKISPNAKVLIVTLTDEKMSEDYTRILMANRQEYATRHGYQTFYTDASTYTHLTQPAPSSWALIPALRHALTLHPDVDYIWSLSPHALIMNNSLSLDTHIFSRLSSLMLKDIPVVPPDSVIHTFSHLKPNQAHLIISQDVDNLAHTSFLLRNTPTIRSDGQPADSWSQFFLDAWFDPLYRNYAFQKAENHALEHLVQWHPTVLANFVVIDQRVLNSYSHPSAKVKDQREHDSLWQQGDFVVNFKGCREQEQRDCEKEMRQWFTRWQTQVEQSEGRKTVVKLQNEQYAPGAARAPVKATKPQKEETEESE